MDNIFSLHCLYWIIDNDLCHFIFHAIKIDDSTELIITISEINDN